MILIKGPLYDKLKFLALIALPAFGTLYFTLAGIWGLPGAEQVVKTVLAVDTFLGVILQLSSTAYNRATATGTMNVVEGNAGQTTFNLELDGDPEEEMPGKKRVIFDVKEKAEKVREVKKRAGGRPSRRKHTL